MKIWKALYLIEILIIASILLAIYSVENQNFKLITCDVGQGDAILAVYGSTQILTDGGPDSRVLDCLGKYMPYWDREIELVVLTHPDKDHFGGLIGVLERYQVNTILKSKAMGGSQEYQALENLIGGKGIRVIYAKEGLSIGLGKIYLDILSPKDTNIGVNQENQLNNYSIVTELRFLNFKALLTGDIEIEGINELLIDGKIKDVDYLKVPHHGSKNNISTGLLKFSNPEVAVISVGKNSYGHPNKEVLDLLNRYQIKYFRTDQKGDVLITTNGLGNFKVLD